MPSRVSINVFKVHQERPEDAFGRWKDKVKFVGEIQGGGQTARIYTATPEDMGRTLVRNIRRMDRESAELVSEARGTRLEDMAGGRRSALERCEVEPILKALVGELGYGNVVDRTSD